MATGFAAKAARFHKKALIDEMYVFILCNWVGASFQKIDIYPAPNISPISRAIPRYFITRTMCI
jgi:hypothetical protein